MLFKVLVKPDIHVGMVVHTTIETHQSKLECIYARSRFHINQMNQAILIGLVLCNCWTMTVWYYRFHAFQGFFLPIFIPTILFSFIVWILRHRVRYGVIIYIFVFSELNGIALWKRSQLMYGTMHAENIPSSQPLYYVMTTHASIRIDSIFEWLDEKEVTLIYNEKLTSGKTSINDMYASVLERAYQLSKADGDEFVLVLEDDAIPMQLNWRKVLIQLKQYATFQHYDLMYLDHRSYLTKTLQAFLHTTGTVGMLFRVNALLDISNFIRTHPRNDSMLYDHIISSGCQDRLFHCDAFPLFRETGTPSLLDTVSHK